MRWTMAVFLLLAGCGAAEPGAPGDVAGPELREVSSPTDAPADVGTDPGSDPGPELPQDAAADILEELPDVAAETNLDLPGGDDGPRACDCPGPSVRVTLNNIPATMNGSEPYVANDLLEHAFHLALPTRGFLWQVVTDCPCGGCGDGLEAGLGEQGGYEEWFTDGQWDVDQDLPAGPAELCARVTDGCGNMSPWACLPTEIVVMTPALHPFQPPDPWLLVWRRDHRTITAGGEGEAPVLSEPGADGTWDVVQDLRLLGLGTADPTPEWAAMDCGWAQGGDECLLRRLLENVRRESYKFYFKEEDGTCLEHCADIVFFIEGEAGAPDPAAFAYETLSGDELTRSFSMIGFGGGDLAESLLGLSESVDERNTGNENNAKEGYGCLTTSVARYILEALEEDPDLSALAAVAFGGIVPALGGAALGSLPEDHRIVDPSVPDGDLSPEALQRRKALAFMLDAAGFGLAALAVHEIGHSVGLVAYGAPPQGLFGGEKEAAFVENPEGCKGAHLDTEGFNLMQAGPGSGAGFELSMDLLSEPIGFNELNAAYLRGEVVLLP